MQHQKYFLIPTLTCINEHVTSKILFDSNYSVAIFLIIVIIYIYILCIIYFIILCNISFSSNLYFMLIR